MGLSANVRLLGKLIGVCSVAAGAMMLAGCGGGGSTSASSSASTSTTGASSSVSSTPASTGAQSSAQALVALSSAYYTAEPASSVQVTINRSGDPNGTATVGYTTINGTAAAGTDYAATSGSVSWSDGDTSAKIVTVPVTSHASGKNFALSLTSVQGPAEFGSPAAATISVTSSAAASSSSGTGSVSVDNVVVAWAAPTENTDGSALTNLAGYNIYYGTSAASLNSKISVKTVGISNYVISNLSHGTWFFAVTSVNASGIESSPSGTASATI